MFAFAWPWHEGGSALPDDLAQRLGNSLCSGIGGSAAARGAEGLHWAYRPLRQSVAAIRAWRPAVLDDGRQVVFHGYFDNAAEIAAQLGQSPHDPARLYAAALDRWGDAAYRRIIGEYAAVIANPANRRLHLARSPLRAPPLCYATQDGFAAAASVPRALFAAGVPRQLNESRLADSAVLNFSDEEEAWFEGVWRVPVGSVVELRPGQARALRTVYRLADCPDIRMASDADYLQRASQLLDEAVEKCLSGAQRPGTTLSSGLDSPQVAVRAMRHLAPGQKLPTFTFHPAAAWDGRCEPTMLGNERPLVEAFAAMHPALDPHFVDNAGYAHDHRWREMFHLMDGAPSGACNMYVFHGIWSRAQQQGCDRLLLAEWGNYTFSDKGEWGFVEYLLSGRWGQLWQALKRNPHDTRPMVRRFIALSIMPLLPLGLWRALRRIVHPRTRDNLELISPLTKGYRERSGAVERIARTGFELDRYQPWNRRHAQALLFAITDCESAEVLQCFEQLYGIPQRDPMAYRPFVEFCYGLPVHMFMRDGVQRWMAKEMARGIMPEDQRANRRNGRWDADWLHRIKAQREACLAELDEFESDPRLAAMIDIPRLRGLLNNLPDGTLTDTQQSFPIEMSVPRGFQAARFVRYAEGRNH